MSANVDLNQRPDYDAVLQDIADYVLDYRIDSTEALDTARNCLMDTLGCGLLALRFPECTKHLGPLVEGTLVPHGARVPGTSFRLDPVKAAWDIGCIVRWLDYNDTWLAAEWGHPSDNLGGILAVADHLAETPGQRRSAAEHAPGTGSDDHGPRDPGRDRPGELVQSRRPRPCAAGQGRVHRRLRQADGADREQLLAALSHAFVDGQALRTYRHAPNAGSRKSWAAGDATSRGVRLADIACAARWASPACSARRNGVSTMSCSATPARTWRPSPRTSGASASPGLRQLRDGKRAVQDQLPAEFHAQTAAEAAVRLHPLVKDRLQRISRIVITTHESAIRIISKVGPLANPADRDHCLQYMTAVPLIFGDLVAEHYEDAFHAAHPLIDRLREKMEIVEEPRYSREYLEADKRSIANAVEVFFDDGSSTGQVAVEYPLGHRRRRAEGIPLLQEKFKANLATRFPPQRCQRIFDLCSHQASLEATPVNRFMNLLAI